jgi:hypothetical protein
VNSIAMPGFETTRIASDQTISLGSAHDHGLNVRVAVLQ